MRRYSLSLTYLLTDLTTYLLTHSLTHSLTYLLTHKIYLKQDGCESLTAVNPYESVPWHKSDSSNASTRVGLRCESSLWSHKYFDINEVGASVFLLPSRDWFASRYSLSLTYLLTHLTTYSLTD
jgi:hypothetical protein